MSVAPHTLQGMGLLKFRVVMFKTSWFNYYWFLFETGSHYVVQALTLILKRIYILPFTGKWQFSTVKRVSAYAVCPPQSLVWHL
jgi:hypothetical protein